MPEPTPVNYGTPNSQLTRPQLEARQRRRDEDVRATFELDLAREARAHGFDDVDEYNEWRLLDGRFH